MKFELMILKNLFKNDAYVRKVLPHLKEEYFTDHSEKKLFNIISEYINKYNTIPSYESLSIILENTYADNVSYENIKNILSEIHEDKETSDLDWLIDETEKHCKDSGIYNAIQTSVNIFSGKEKNLKKEAIPSLLSEAIAITFDPKVGHEYLEGFEERFRIYTEKTNRFPTHLNMINKITNGGLKSGTLNLVAAGTNVGKSIILGDCAANWLIKGYNVLYITLEMDEKDGIGRRIDANLMDVTMEDLASISKEIYINKANRIKKMTTGKFWIKELPESSTTALNIESVINEILTKQKTNIDILVLDYLNLVGSYRHKDSSKYHIYVKKVAEEIRALARKLNIPILSAVQFNRSSGEDNSDPDFSDIGDSHGISQTCDLLLGMSIPEELIPLNQVLFTQMKSRYGNKKLKRFVLGLEVDKMKFYDVEQFAQNDLMKQEITEPVKQEQKIRSQKVRDNSKQINEIRF